MVEIGYRGCRQMCSSSITICEIYVFSSHLKPAALNTEYVIHCDCCLWTFFSDSTYTRCILKKNVKEDDNRIPWLRFPRSFGFILVKLFLLQNTVFTLSSLNITIFIEEHPKKINNYEYIILEQPKQIEFEHCLRKSCLSRRQIGRSRILKTNCNQVNDRYWYKDWCSIYHICRFRLTIPTTSSICIIIFILLTAVSASGTVEWKLKTYPVKFGEEVQIVCTCPKNVTMEHMAWKMYSSGQNGQSVQTLGMFNVSSKMNKYSIIQSYNESEVIYMLVIKNFDVADLDHIYKCEFGFKDAYRKITINERDFIALPSGDKIKKSFFLLNGSVNAYIRILHVYPKPICTADFKGVNITGSLNTTHIKQPVLYNTTIEVLYNTNECDGDLNINCFVGMENITFKHHFNKSCHAVTISVAPTVVPIVIPVVIVVVGIAITIFTCYRKHSRRNRDTGNPSVDYDLANTMETNIQLQNT